MTAWLDALGEGLRHALRGALSDFGALTLLLAAGLFYSWFYPLPYSAEVVQGARVLVVDQDRTSLSRQLIRFFDAAQAVEVAGVVTSLPEAEAALARREVAGVALLPAGLRADVLAGRGSTVTLLVDGRVLALGSAAAQGLARAAGTLGAGITLRALAAGGASPAQAAAQRDPVRYLGEPLFNTAGTYGGALVPSVGLLIVQQTGLIGIALLIGTWLAAGRLGPAGAAGRRPGAAALGMLGAFTLLVLLQALYFVGFVTWSHDHPWNGQVWTALGPSALYAVALAGLGTLLGLWFRSRERPLQLLLPTSIPLFFVAGASWPAEALPPLLSALRWLAPSTAAIDALVRLDQLGASPAEAARGTWALAALALGYGGAGWWALRRSLQVAPPPAEPATDLPGGVPAAETA